jgi:hypothetical protein
VVSEDVKSRWTIAGQQSECNQPARSRVSNCHLFCMAGNVFHLPMEVLSLWKTSGGIDSYPEAAAPHYEQYIQAALENVPWCSAPACVCEVLQAIAVTLKERTGGSAKPKFGVAFVATAATDNVFLSHRQHLVESSWRLEQYAELILQYVHRMTKFHGLEERSFEAVCHVMSKASTTLDLLAITLSQTTTPRQYTWPPLCSHLNTGTTSHSRAVTTPNGRCPGTRVANLLDCCQPEYGECNGHRCRNANSSPSYGPCTSHRVSHKTVRNVQGPAIDR